MTVTARDYLDQKLKDPEFARSYHKPGQLTALIFPDDDQFSAYCPELDVATCGDTAAEAREMLTDAVITTAASLVENRDKLAGSLLDKLPYAWLVYGKDEQEVYTLLFAEAD